MKSFYLVTTVAVKGWCDSKQREFGDWDSRHAAAQFARDGKLKPHQFKVHARKSGAS